ncbi:hypothetical protein FRAAL0706 [Frankia alni ACN14a]|uniref:Uncharacterized protein n=1 Tax=Frankia alni (strain DSM 45986 / CECT 9034 / ACN14a) TaxID=326424 RepID=Q0RST0_FRAAA|nr:hypothetical protein FRAAL0706 [Frankia alni ACN14a]
MPRIGFRAADTAQPRAGRQLILECRGSALFLRFLRRRHGVLPAPMFALRRTAAAQASAATRSA